LTRLTVLFTRVLALLAPALWAGPAIGGRIESRGDRTVIHVTAFDVPNPGNTSTPNQADVAVVRAFKRRFPEIFAAKYRDLYQADPGTYGGHNWNQVEIEVEPFSGIRIEGVEVDLLAIAGGLAPDILYVNFRKSDTYIQNGFLHPLDRPEDLYLQAMSSEETDFRIHPKLWPIIRRKGPAGETHVWAMPFGGALGKALLFRKDLFAAKGVPFPTADWTWDDLMDAAQRLTSPEERTYGFLLTRGKHEAYHWMTFLWSAGGEAMLYDEAADQWRCVFDSPAAAEALDFYIRLSTERWVDAQGRPQRGYSTKDAANAYDKWERGEVAMMFDNLDEKVFSAIDPEVVGMAPVPKGPGGQRASELNSRMMGLFSGIEVPAVRDAAWEYIKFYDSREAMEVRTRVMVEGGFGRFVNPRYLRMFGYPEVERLAPKGWAEIFDISIETSKPEPYGGNSNIAYEMMTFPINQAEDLALNDKLPETREARLSVMLDLLRAARERADEKMMGIVPPGERVKRRIVAFLVLVAIVMTFALVFRRISHTFTPPEVRMKTADRWAFRKYAWCYLLLLPAVLTILVWAYVPLARGTVMAFQDYRLLGDSRWVGLDNFGDVLFDSDWWRSAWNSLRYSFLVLALTFLPPIALAILLQEVPRGKILFRTVYYLPAVITGIVTILLWKQFYEPTERGVLNAIMMRIPAAGYVAAGAALFGGCAAFASRLRMHEMYLPAWGFLLAGIALLATCLNLAAPMLFPPHETWLQSLPAVPSRLFARIPEPFRWLSNSETAMLACVIPMVWAGMGPGCLIYLAALKGIADDYYEAADIDGASFIDKILFVVFPTIKALVIINFVGVFIATWYTAEGNILVMTGGAANTEVAGLHIWYKAFTYLHFGPATAMAWMLGFMLIGFTVHQLRILSRVEFRTTGAGGGKR